MYIFVFVFDNIVLFIGTVVLLECRSSDCSAVKLQLSPKREAQYLDMNAQ